MVGGPDRQVDLVAVSNLGGAAFSFDTHLPRDGGRPFV